MAENRYKKANTPKEPKSNSKKGAKEEKQERKFILKFVQDKRFLLILGIALMFFAAGLGLSMLSYLFNGTEDQSVAENFMQGHPMEDGKEVLNWLGLTGAFLAHLFIYKGFGVAAVLFVPVIFFIGFRLVFKVDMVKLQAVWKAYAFFLLWISLALGYLVFTTDTSANLSFLCGAFGYELAALLNALVGIGTFFIILLLLVVFAVYYLNITSFSGLIGAANPLSIIRKKDPETAIAEEEEEEEESEEEESEEEESEEEEEYEEEEEEDTEEESEELVEEWEIKDNTKGNKSSKKTGKAELELEVQDTTRPEDKELPVGDHKVVIDNQFVELPEEHKEKDIDTSKLENYDPTLDLPRYKYPGLDLLNEYDPSKVQVTKEELEANKDRIIDTLKNYSIGIASIRATIGPTVTLYEIVPDAGIRISKIKNLEDDIALSLSALGIRIIAPMPGKGTIGIEVPNKNKEMVSVRSVLATEKFQLSNMELPIALGKTITNEVFVTDLAAMPHLLMAGATGQGKSVGLNILLACLLYKKHPSQLKFVLVDPKKVELSVYTTIEKHFLAKLPDTEEAIITDTKKVVHTLNSLCIEMDNRYLLLKDGGCRNLKEYNQKFIERKLNPNHGHRFLPYIVLVIDELADLMMTAGKEVELPIARLAQLARAIGIHLVVATQRPSVNVITGIIKANFPARLSFRVTSKVDSRTILDESGSEQLVGKGDMLLKNGSDITRLQCAFIDTPEVDRICSFIGEQKGYDSAYKLPEFNEDDMEDGGRSDDFSFAHRDSLFDEAARLLVSTQQGSTSLIQRRMQLGYNRAGRIMDQLEMAGIVGPNEGSKAREVLIKDLNSLEQLLIELGNK